jgi:hypothetical protein
VQISSGNGGVDMLFILEILAAWGDWHDLLYFTMDPKGRFLKLWRRFPAHK